MIFSIDRLKCGHHTIILLGLPAILVNTLILWVLYQNYQRNYLILDLQVSSESDISTTVSNPIEQTIQTDEVKEHCIKTAVVRNVSTTLCPYNTSIDYSSGFILRQGVYEPELLNKFLYLIEKAKIEVVFDIGTHMGQYSLFSAKLVPRVVSVEPFYDHNVRLLAAAQIEKVSDRITLLSNAVSDVSGEWKLLQSKSNLGEQNILHFKNLKFNQKDPNLGKYVVQTITMNDLVRKIDTKYHHKRAIIKMDIEGMEKYAFLSADKLFESFDFRAVLMESVHVARNSKVDDPIIPKFFGFFLKRNFTLHDPVSGKRLNHKDWKIWHSKHISNIIWIRNVPFK